MSIPLTIERNRNNTAIQKQRARTIAVANQKGGVGKTTTAVNLATALAATKMRVLLIDIDAQGNASTGLDIEKEIKSNTVYDLLINDVKASDAVVSTQIPGLDLLPASMHLAGAELELLDAEYRESRLANSLEEITGNYDYVLIDCPPALGLLTLNALCAAHSVLVPLQCEFYALEGLSHLIRTIERVRQSFNPQLEIQGVVLTMFDRRNNLSDMVAHDVREHFGDKVFKTVIPRNVRISEAPSFGKPVLLYDWRCKGSKAYIHLASEILKRERGYTI